MVLAKVYKLQKHFEGVPKPTDLKVVEEELPELKNGEFLAEAVYISVDPYMRVYEKKLKIGATMLGSQVAKVVESKNPKYPVGEYVVGKFGWRSHTIHTGQETYWLPPYLVDFGGLSPSYGLGVLGMPGNTAYFGLLEICQPKSGETVVVSGAAGAVGSLVGQIAKIKGCKVIGIAGSDEKGKWLIGDLKFDSFINYKSQDINEALKEVAPEGVDCYFDNVGGEISSTVISNMNEFGRIAACGAISSYNDDTDKASPIQYSMVFKQLKMEGFVVTRWQNRWMEGINQNKKWIEEGKLKIQETITEGFDNLFAAFVQLFQGTNVGKSIVKV